MPINYNFLISTNTVNLLYFTSIHLMSVVNLFKPNAILHFPIKQRINIITTYVNFLLIS